MIVDSLPFLGQLLCFGPIGHPCAGAGWGPVQEPSGYVSFVSQMDTGGHSRIMARGHTPGQIMARVRQSQKKLTNGRQLTEATWYRWLNQYGSETNAEASKRTKQLEKANTRLKQLLAEKELAIDILNFNAQVRREQLAGEFGHDGRSAVFGRGTESYLQS